MLVIATRDFRANKCDVKKGEILKVEDEWVMLNNQSLCDIGSDFFEVSFEVVEE